MLKYFSIIFVILVLIIINYKDKVYSDKTILLGTSLPKTGIMRSWGKNVYIGADAYFQYVNNMKLLKDNKKIKLISYDDKYEPELTNDNINKLINNKSLFAFFGFVGTPTVKYILPIIDNTDLPFIAPFSGASFLRNSKNKNIINFRSSYDEEIKKLINYLTKKKKIKRFAIFYQNDTYGEEGYIALKSALNKNNLVIHGEGMYKRNTLSIRHAFTEIKDNSPEAIVMVGTYKANALFIKKAREDDLLKNVIFCNISFSDANEMIKELNSKTKNIIFSQVVPYYADNKIDIIREYKFVMKKYYPNEQLGFASLESFLAAKTIVSAINNIKGSITSSKFLNEMKNLPQDTLKGIKIHFKNSQLLNKIYLFKYENSKFEEIQYNDK